MDVLLPFDVAAAARASFAGDSAIDSMVVDLAYGDDLVDPDARYVGLYRAPAPVSPGDFMVLGGFADPDVANFALLNRKAYKPDDDFLTGRAMRYVPTDDDRSYSGRASMDAYGLDND